MADFEVVIRRTVDGLIENTPEMRERVYQKAKNAVLRQLRNMDPRPSDGMIERQIQKLGRAILAVESQLGSEPMSVATRRSTESAVDTSPSSRLLKWLLPPAIADDFFNSLMEIYIDIWLPNVEGKAKWFWHRECLSMIVRYWLQCSIANARRWLRL